MNKRLRAQSKRAGSMNSHRICNCSAPGGRFPPSPQWNPHFYASPVHLQLHRTRWSARVECASSFSDSLRTRLSLASGGSVNSQAHASRNSSIRRFLVREKRGTNELVSDGFRSHFQTLCWCYFFFFPIPFFFPPSSFQQATAEELLTGGREGGSEGVHGREGPNQVNELCMENINKLLNLLDPGNGNAPGSSLPIKRRIRSPVAI